MDDDSDLYSSLEDREHQLIQHLRTSGIRKPREIELINEVIQLRQERRKSHSALDSVAKKHWKENISLKQQLASSVDDKISEAVIREESAKRILRKKDDEIKMIIKHYDTKLMNEKELNYTNMRAQADNLNQVNECRLRAVDKKIAELMTEKSSHDNKIAETMAFDITAKAVAELNDQHNLELIK
jgi:hypothetical protein